MNSDIQTLHGYDFDEAPERQGEYEWNPLDPQEIKDRYREYLPASDDAMDPSYETIDQFLAAAKGQPGVVFGFRAGIGAPSCFLKFEDNQFFLGTPLTDKSFASIDGNDGDADEDDLPILPSPGAGGAVKESVAEIVESLIGPARKVKRTLSESEVNRIALALLGEE